MIERSYSRANAAPIVNLGLRQYMVKVYNFMSAGLALTALTAYLVANTPLLKLFFSMSPQGQISLSGFGWKDSDLCIFSTNSLSSLDNFLGIHTWT